MTALVHGVYADLGASWDGCNKGALRSITNLKLLYRSLRSDRHSRFESPRSIIGAWNGSWCSEDARDNHRRSIYSCTTREPVTSIG